MAFRRTKIICTIGPATAKYPVLEQMAAAGMDLVRLNMSHADHAGAAEIIQWIKTLNRRLPDPISVILDTQGPEIRTGVVAEPLDLKSGQVVSLSVRSDDDVETSSIQVNYQELIDILEPGNRISVDNGLINFEVLENRGKRLLCRVLDGGRLGSKRHVNLPGVRIDLPSITAKDRTDIQFGLQQEVDYIAVSFVGTAQDVEAARSIIREGARPHSDHRQDRRHAGAGQHRRHRPGRRRGHGGSGRLGDRDDHCRPAQRAAAHRPCLRPLGAALHRCHPPAGVHDPQSHPHPRRSDGCGQRRL